MLKRSLADRLKITPTINSKSNDEFKMEDINRIIPGENCICGRKPKTLVCIQCKMFTYGRIAIKCPEHINVTFLMDFITCPHCLGPNKYLRGVDVDISSYRDINLKEMNNPKNFSRSVECSEDEL